MKKILIYLIKLYQKTISKEIGQKGIQCKYYPTCSEYTKIAIDRFGIIKGSSLAIKRIAKCNALAKSNQIDLVPTNSNPKEV